jgi:hypothetical protein
MEATNTPIPPQKPAVHLPRLPTISPSTHHQKPSSNRRFPQEKQGSTTSEIFRQIPANATIEKAA